MSDDKDSKRSSPQHLLDYDVPIRSTGIANEYGFHQREEDDFTDLQGCELEESNYDSGRQIKEISFF
jgi:hypothetical protein